MPWLLERRQKEGDLHFLTFSCRHRAPLLNTPSARTAFLSSLEATRLRAGLEIHGYVIMPEHVHLLLNEPAYQSLSTAIQGLKQSVSHFLREGQGPFWEPRYYDFNVYSEQKRLEKLRYMHRNPVGRGLVERPEDWAWSSFRQYANHERGIVRLAFQPELKPDSTMPIQR